MRAPRSCVVGVDIALAQSEPGHGRSLAPPAGRSAPPGIAEKCSYRRKDATRQHEATGCRSCGTSSRPRRSTCQEELLATMPPTLQLSIESRVRTDASPENCASLALTCAANRRPAPPRTSAQRPPRLPATCECRVTSTRMPSVTDWPDRLVPEARNTSGRPSSRPTRKSPCTSAYDSRCTTTSGTSR